MKRAAFVLMILCLLLSGTAYARESRIILYTVYEQQGWGDRVEVHYIDEDGVIRSLEGYASSMGWPYSPEEQVRYLSGTSSAKTVGEISFDDVFDLKSMIVSVEDQGRKMHAGGYNDYGTVSSFAVRYDHEDEPSCVLLGAWGDNAFTNTDPNAQGLYAALYRLLTGTEDIRQLMAYIGAQPVRLSDFLGYDPQALKTARISAVYNDCEAGPFPVELSTEDEAAIRQLALGGSVLLKANAVSVTGGYVDYIFTDENGQVIAVITLDHGLLYSRDGMYYLDQK